MSDGTSSALGDPARLRALRRINLKDRPALEPLDRLSRLAARLLDVPVVLVSLVDESRQFFAGGFGLPEPYASLRQTPLTHSFCRHVVESADVLRVEDARADPIVRDTPAVPELGVAAYLGVPLRTRDGFVLGAFCAIDTSPRRWGADDSETLGELATAAVAEMELRAEVAGHEQAAARLRYMESAVVHASDAVLIAEAGPVDLPGPKIVYVNDAFSRMTGYAPEEILGLTPRVLQGPGTERPKLDLIRAALKDWESVRVELRNYRKDGSEFWVELEISPAADESGWVTHWVSVQRDISERKHLEEAERRSRENLEATVVERAAELAVAAEDLQRESSVRALAEKRLSVSEGRYRALVESAVDAIVTTDGAGAIVGWDGGAEQMFGHTAAEALAMNVSELMPGRFAADHSEGMGGFRPDGPSRVMGRVVELAGRRKGGEEFPLELSLNHWSAGGATNFTAIVRDITERKKAEEAVRLLERAIAAIPQGVCISDPSRPDNPVIYVNRGFEQMTGYSAAEMVGRNCRFLQGPDTDSAAVAELRDAIRAGRPVTVEILNYKKDGTPFRNTLSVAPVRDEGGRVTHYVGAQTDTTEFRLLESQLRQSQKMEAVGHLAGGVAHDFNNLLTVINGYSEILMSAPDGGGPAAELLAEVHAAGNRAAELTRQLLAFSRKTVLQPRFLDLNELVAGVQRMLGRLIGEDVRLSTSLSPSGCRVWVDPGQVEQVLVNLAVNARDAMPTGGRLAIETDTVSVAGGEAEARPGRYARLSVIDTGCGMTDAVKARLFEPFFTTKEVGRGTGLGLATVYGIVRQSGGHIAVESEVGRGTAFRVFVPLAEGADASPAPQARTPAPRGAETVLLVEDEERVRKVAAMALRSSGYTVLEASGADEATKAFDLHRDGVRLLLTDVVMPGESGRVLAERLTRSAPALRVLYMSGYTDDAILRHGVFSAETAFVQKPFSVDGLLRAVRSALDGPGRDGPSGGSF